MKKQVLLFALLAIQTAVFSQTTIPLYNLTESKIAIDAGDPIFVGPEHIAYLPSIEGTAYYLYPQWQKGTIVFQHALYTSVYLKYDLVTDEVVIRHLDSFSAVNLFSPRIQSFILGERRFVPLPASEDLKAGFYEELSVGKLSLYAKHAKQLEEMAVMTTIERKFTEKHHYYLLKDGQYHRLNNHKALLNLLPDRKTELKAWLKTSGMSYKDNPEATLKKMVDHYNQLSR